MHWCTPLSAVSDFIAESLSKIVADRSLLVWNPHASLFCLHNNSGRACCGWRFGLSISLSGCWRTSSVCGNRRLSIDCSASVATARCQWIQSTSGCSLKVRSDMDDCQLSKTSEDAPFRKPVFPVPVVPLRIDDSSPTDGAKELLKIIRPEWPADRLRFTVLCRKKWFSEHHFGPDW